MPVIYYSVEIGVPRPGERLWLWFRFCFGLGKLLSQYRAIVPAPVLYCFMGSIALIFRMNDLSLTTREGQKSWLREVIVFVQKWFQCLVLDPSLRFLVAFLVLVGTVCGRCASNPLYFFWILPKSSFVQRIQVKTKPILIRASMLSFSAWDRHERKVNQPQAGFEPVKLTQRKCSEPVFNALPPLPTYLQTNKTLPKVSLKSYIKKNNVLFSLLQELRIGIISHVFKYFLKSYDL